MKKTALYVSVVTVLVGLALPLPAQRVNLGANVPFEFKVGNRSMPAGEYTIATATPNGVAVLKISGEASSALVLTVSTSAREWTGEVRLVFHRYGDQYFLSSVVDGYQGTSVEIQTSRAERELSKVASRANFETITVLARR